MTTPATDIPFNTCGCTYGPDELRDRILALVAQNVDYNTACRKTYEPSSRASLWLYTTPRTTTSTHCAT